MKTRSFFDEQVKQSRFTIFFLLMGLIWMGIMGYLVVMVHLSFVNLFSPVRDEIVRVWSIRGIVTGMGFWIIIWIILLISFSRFVPRFMGAHPASGRDLTILSNAIKEVAIASGEHSYKISPFILETDVPNAFACGKSTRGGAIVITRGLMNILSPEELRAVIAHEFAHLKNGDSFFSAQAISYCWALISISIGTYYLVLIAFILLIVGFLAILKITEAFSDDSGEGCVVSAIGFMIGLALLFVGIYYLFVYVVIMAFALFLVALGVKASASSISKAREYLADACSAQWTREPMALASALDKIRNSERLPIRSLAIAPLWIHTPSAFKREKVNRLLTFLFETHPPIEDRIKKLLEMGGSYVLMDIKLREILASLKPSIWRRLKELFPPILATLLALFISYGIFQSIVKIPASKKIEERVQLRPSPIYEVVVIKPVVNLREGPSKTRPVLEKLHKGDRLKVFREEKDWIMVEYNRNGISLKGWVYKKLVRKVE